jgi:hypothetical protein
MLIQDDKSDDVNGLSYAVVGNVKLKLKLSHYTPRRRLGVEQIQLVGMVIDLTLVPERGNRIASGCGHIDKKMSSSAQWIGNMVGHILVWVS